MIQIDSSAGLLYDPRLADPVRRLFLAGAKIEIALNKTGALTLTIPEGHPVYGRLTESVSEVWVLTDGEEIFRGYVREIHEDIDGLQEIVTEGLKGLLRREYFRPYTVAAYGGTAANWLQMVCDAYNSYRRDTGAVLFRLGTVDEQALSIEGKDYKDILSCIDNDFLKAVGGYLYVTREGNENVISWTKTSGPIGDQVIAFGVNLTDYRREDNAEDLFTAVIPLGKSDGDNGRLTIRSVNQGSDMLADAAAVAARGLIVKVFNHNEIEDANELLAAGQADLAGAGALATSIEADAVDLRDAGVNVERLRLGHRNYVQPRRGAAPMLLPISRISADLLDPGSGKFTFSQEYQTLTQQNSGAAAAASSATAAAAYASETASAAAAAAAAAATPASVAQQIAASESKYVDYVTETGSGSGWVWRKWQSGAVEMWANGLEIQLGSWAVYSGDLYRSTGNLTYPVELADAEACVQVTAARAQTPVGAIIGYVRKYTTGAMVYVIRPDQNQSKFYADIYVRGIAAQTGGGNG